MDEGKQIFYSILFYSILFYSLNTGVLPYCHGFIKFARMLSGLPHQHLHHAESRTLKDVTGRLLQRFIVSVFIYIMHILVYREYFILLPRYEHL